MRLSDFWQLVSDEFGEAYGRVLVRDQDRVEAGQRFEARGEVAGIEQDAGAEQLHQQARVSKMSQAHGSQYAPTVRRIGVGRLCSGSRFSNSYR